MPACKENEALLEQSDGKAPFSELNPPWQRAARAIFVISACATLLAHFGAKWSAWCLVMSVSALALLLLVVGSVPCVQRGLTYAHWISRINGIGRGDLEKLTKVRIGHFTRNVAIAGGAGTLKAWHLAPARTACELARLGPDEREARMDSMLREEGPVILFLHGQAGHRAVKGRLETCRALSAQLGAHALLLDYRGFGDSAGAPDQDGLVEDALAAFLWLEERRAGRPLLVYGQSLGTAVAVQLLLRLGRGEAGEAHLRPAGAVLDVPFASVRAAMAHNPVAWPLRMLGLETLATWRLRDTWDSAQGIGEVRCPLLIFGAQHDAMVGPESAGLLAKRAVAAQRCTHVLLSEACHSDTFAFDEWLVCMDDFMRQVGCGAAIAEQRPPDMRS